MKRALITLSLSLFLLAAGPQVNPVQRFDGANGTCTAFSISKKNGYWLTAGHCALPPMSVGGVEAILVAKEEAEDLAVVKSIPAPPLRLSRRHPEIGDEARLVGFPGGYGPVTFFGRVSDPTFTLPDGEIKMILHEGGGRGMSGAPIVIDGEVVGVVQGGYQFPSNLIWSPIHEAVVKFARPYWRN